MSEVFMTGAVEGPVDEVVLRKVGAVLGIEVTPVYVTNGQEQLFQRLSGFNQAAQYSPWVVVVDLNSSECPPALLDGHLPEPAPLMKFRVAVRAIEAWILGDVDRIAAFLGVSRARIPWDPDSELDPKQTVVNVASHSKRRAIREDMVPREGGGRRVGPGYAARLIEFVADEDKGWRPEIAANRSESLMRCVHALRAG